MSMEASISRDATNKRTNLQEAAITTGRLLTSPNQSRANKVFGAFDAVMSQCLVKVKVVVTSILFSPAHWYLYMLGFCKEEESDSTAEMGFKVRNE